MPNTFLDDSLKISQRLIGIDYEFSLQFINSIYLACSSTVVCTGDIIGLIPAPFSTALATKLAEPTTNLVNSAPNSNRRYYDSTSAIYHRMQVLCERLLYVYRELFTKSTTINSTIKAKYLDKVIELYESNADIRHFQTEDAYKVSATLYESIVLVRDILTELNFANYTSTDYITANGVALNLNSFETVTNPNLEDDINELLVEITYGQP